MQKIIGGKRLHSMAFVLLLCTMAAFLSSCTQALQPGYNPAQKIAPEKLKEDAALLRKILEANHPSLYWYTPKDSMDFYFDATICSITDSLTELQFRKKIAAVVGKIRCGHTAVRSSKQYARYFFAHRPPLFPLNIKAWGDTMVVINNAVKTDTVFKRGTIITSINGLPNKVLLDSIFQFISTDGYSDNFKYQLTSLYFPLFYYITFGVKDSCVITYIDSACIQKTGVVYNFKPGPDTTRKRLAGNIPFPKPTRKLIRAANRRNNTMLSFDSCNTAYMRVNSFLGAGLRRRFRQSFKTIREKHATNLVVDLRENGGGSIGLSANLTRYIMQHPFTMADTVAAISRKFRYGKYIHPAWLYKAIMFFTSSKEEDGRYHFTYLEHHTYHPKKNLLFTGKVYIIQGGFTFSAASMFVARLKGQPHVTVVGEETGGGYYGNSAVHLPTIVLPNSGIEISLPLYRYVINASFPKNGRGVLPDVFVGPSTDAIKRGIDTKMEKVKELITAHKSE